MDGTLFAPWTLVEANDRNFARMKVPKALVERIEAILEELYESGIDCLDKPRKRP